MNNIKNKLSKTWWGRLVILLCYPMYIIGETIFYISLGILWLIAFILINPIYYIIKGEWFVTC